MTPLTLPLPPYLTLILHLSFSQMKESGFDPERDLKSIRLVHIVGNPVVRRQLKAMHLEVRTRNREEKKRGKNSLHYT